MLNFDRASLDQGKVAIILTQEKSLPLVLISADAHTYHPIRLGPVPQGVDLAGHWCDIILRAPGKVGNDIANESAGAKLQI